MTIRHLPFAICHSPFAICYLPHAIRNMRIGLIIYNSLDTVSGGYLYDRKLVEHLRKCGDEVEIISLPYSNYATHLAHNLQPHSASLRGQVSLIPNRSFDILLQDELNHPSLFLLNRFIKGRYPILSIVHHLRISEQHPEWQSVFYRVIERAYLDSVDGFIFNSEATRKVVLSVVGARHASPLQYVVAYPSGDRFNVNITPDQVRARAVLTPFKILFVGNLIRRKGLHTLLDALKNVNGDWELVIVGNGNIDRSYAETIQRRLTPQIKLLGSLNDAQLADQFAISHLLVVPSQYEGFGIVYLEGMGFGLPAIASASGGASEIITHGENGFLIEPNDAASLTHHLQSLIFNHQLLIEMSLNALERFKKHPTWEASMGRVREFLKRIAYSV